MTDDELLTVKEAAARLKVNPETVRRWLKDGSLGGLRLGARKLGWRISEADLAAFINERRTGAQS